MAGLRGERIGSAYVRVYYSSSGDSLNEDVKKDKGFEKAGESAAKQTGEGYNKEWTKQLRDRLNEDEVFQRNSLRSKKGWETRRRKLDEETAKLANKNSDSIFSRLRKGWSDTRNDLRKAEKDAEGFWHKLANVGDEADGVGTKFGKLWGKGSRNNFLNFVGTIVGGIAEIPVGLVSAFGKVGSFIQDNIVNKFKEADTFAQGFGSSLAELASFAPEALGGLAVVLIGLPILLSTVASLIMLVTGAVVALAAALSVALVGGIAIAGAALVPLIAGFGVVALAMTNMSTKSQHAFTGFTASLRKSFQPLAQIAAAHLFKNMADDGKLLTGVLDSLHPVVAGIADSIRIIGENFLKAMSGPGAQKFIRFLGNVLPSMVQQIGQIALNLGTFFAEAFQAASPLVQEFLGWLTGVTQSWVDFGKGGKKSPLAQWFRDITPTLHSVGHLIEQIVGLVGDLFLTGPAQKGGGDMFQSMADQVHKFRDWLVRAKKDGSLQKLIDDGKEFGSNIGKAAVAVGQLIGALDDPATRRFLIWMVRQFVHIVDTVDQWIRDEKQVFHWFGKIGGAIGRAFGPDFQRAGSRLSAIGTAASNAGGAIKRAFSNIGGWIAGRFNSAISSIRTAWDRLVTFFTGIPSKISSASAWANAGQTIGNAVYHAILTAMNGLPGAIISLFTGLATRIVNSIGNINIWPHVNWPSPPSWLKKVVPGMASGGLALGPQLRLIGEAGPEAVVPLNRNLAQVDPAVRWLSAIAQGKTATPTAGGVGKSMTVGPITVITPTKDPGAVAQQVVNRIAAASYI
jgi:hypothetical protein